MRLILSKFDLQDGGHCHMCQMHSVSGQDMAATPWNILRSIIVIHVSTHCQVITIAEARMASTNDTFALELVPLYLLPDKMYAT